MVALAPAKQSPLWDFFSLSQIPQSSARLPPLKLLAQRQPSKQVIWQAPWRQRRAGLPPRRPPPVKRADGRAKQQGSCPGRQRGPRMGTGGAGRSSSASSPTSLLVAEATASLKPCSPRVDSAVLGGGGSSSAGQGRAQSRPISKARAGRARPPAANPTAAVACKPYLAPAQGGGEQAGAAGLGLENQKRLSAAFNAWMSYFVFRKQGSRKLRKRLGRAGRESVKHRQDFGSGWPQMGGLKSIYIWGSSG